MSETSPGYMVCTHPRSGSTYLCQLLESTGKLGRPADYFNDRHMSARFSDPANPAHLPEQYDYYFAQSASGNGIRGTKMFWFDLARLGEGGVARRFGKYHHIILERRDKVAQAVSSSRALRSGKLYAHLPVSDDDVDYDYVHIRACLAGVLRADECWHTILTNNRITPLKLDYETVVEAPQAAVDRIARFIGLDEPVPIDPARVTLRVQRDGRSTEWYRRFIDDAQKSDPELIARCGQSGWTTGPAKP
jgi:LPS sulfotransferase NodH